MSQLIRDVDFIKHCLQVTVGIAPSREWKPNDDLAGMFFYVPMQKGGLTPFVEDELRNVLEAQISSAEMAWPRVFSGHLWPNAESVVDKTWTANDAKHYCHRHPNTNTMELEQHALVPSTYKLWGDAVHTPHGTMSFPLVFSSTVIMLYCNLMATRAMAMTPQLLRDAAQFAVDKIHASTSAIRHHVTQESNRVRVHWGYALFGGIQDLFMELHVELGTLVVKVSPGMLAALNSVYKLRNGQRIKEAVQYINSQSWPARIGQEDYPIEVNDKLIGLKSPLHSPELQAEVPVDKSFNHLPMHHVRTNADLMAVVEAHGFDNAGLEICGEHSGIKFPALVILSCTEKMTTVYWLQEQPVRDLFDAAYLKK